MPRVHARASTQARAAPAEREEKAVPRGSLVDVVLLVGGTALRYVTTSACITYLPNLLTGRGESLEYSGRLVTAFLVVGGVGLLAGGVLGDRLGHRVVSFVSLTLSVPVLLCFFFAPPAAAIASLLLASVLLAVQNAPGVALTQAAMPKNLGMALGLINGVAFGVGSAAVALLGKAVGRVGPTLTLTYVSLVPLLAAGCFVFVGRVRAGRERAAPGEAGAAS
jgi:FSR family fosmidomycin resistance protein-like MFS transporter